MRLSISNIAWDAAEDEAIAELLQFHNIDAIDVAPGKYFSDPARATDNEVAGIKKWWVDRGIEITGMQALLYGTTGLNVFGSPEVQDAMLRHLTVMCRIGAGLNGKRLVFGSPKNRDQSGLSDQQALDMAVHFFRRLGDIAQSYGVVICLEPNPARYAANFMTTSAETAYVVEEVAHQAIKMQLDTGALTINDEDPAFVVKNWASIIGHVHLSEPDLVPLGDGNTEHGKVNRALVSCLPNHVVTIEMLATKNEPHHLAIKRALGVAIREYHNDGVGGSI